ncbi:diacylglycerol/lipid kinase family protein [Persicirhabdus sediminis]|uniref:Diacylglycerol kinase family lipid kinase n=1 Tax=Persicirhabdus sediminis TaxID=454144 RepID=A0A8J7SME0_9BACT|nr:diacylglycerol kinase family protein [Persicirhabdus sediminis]MBK1792010.1 diacylglycerol kinase family lipid kinase [Persicirhabdus sediminis]
METSIPVPNRIPLLFNPNARSQRGRKTLRFLMANAQRFALYATRDVDDARQLAQKLANDGEPIVCAAGGDGTLNAVVQGLAGSSCVLGVLPAGTMNVFARELGIPYNSLSKALEIIQDGNVREVDLFEANQKPFLQMAGVGFDAKVIEETSSGSKNLIGPFAYLGPAVRVLGQQPPKVTVTCADGRVEEGVCMLAGNGSLYGGQVKLFRKADNDDGLLDALIFKHSGIPFIRDSLLGLATGALDTEKSSITYLQSESFTIESDAQLPLQVDGEYAGRASTFKLCPTGRKLRVLAPSCVKENWLQNIIREIVKRSPRHNKITS